MSDIDYDDGMDAVAQLYIDEVMGADAADVLAPLAAVLQTGGSMAQQHAAASSEKKSTIAAGEASWARMKRAAEAAKWPADISPRVVLADKGWQAVKGSGDLTQMKSAIDQMNSIADMIEARIGGYAPPGGAPVKTGWPLWAKIAVGAIGLGGAYMGYKALRR